MKLLTDKELKQTELEILKHFDKFCKVNDLKYSLAEGTLIGAVRHKGFIPWDDDIDVIMMRDDFERFKKIYKDERYKLIQASDKSVFPYLFIQIADDKTEVVFDNSDKKTVHESGVWIDVFPIDNFPNDKKVLDRIERKIFFYSKLYRWKTRKQWGKNMKLWMNIVWIVSKILLFPVNAKWLRNQTYKLMTKYNEVNTNYKGFWTNYWHHPWVFPAKAFDGYTELEFEGEKFPVISGYDIYLKSEYGDYMKLPPQEKRFSKHEFQAYIK